MSVTKVSKMPKTGFPTGSKLLRKQEKERAYKLHQEKVQGIRHGVDNTPPQQYPHLVVRFKRLQKEEEKQATVDHENQLLMRKMQRIMTRRGRLDNWNDYERRSLNHPHRERQQQQIAIENAGIAKRLERVGPVYDVKEWEDDYKRHEYILERRAEETKDYDEVPTPRKQTTRASKTRQHRKEKEKEEEKYEDDFESDEESKNKTDESSKEQDDSTSRKSAGAEKTTPERKTENETSNSKLPEIDSRKKSQEKENEKEKSHSESKSKQSQVSKLPAVSTNSKKSEERVKQTNGGKKTTGTKNQSSTSAPKAAGRRDEREIGHKGKTEKDNSSKLNRETRKASGESKPARRGSVGKDNETGESRQNKMDKSRENGSSPEPEGHDNVNERSKHTEMESQTKRSADDETLQSGNGGDQSTSTEDHKTGQGKKEKTEAPVERKEGVSPAKNNQSKAPPAKNNQSKAPPAKNNQSKAPPAKNNQSKAPPAKNNQSEATPAKNNQSKAPPAKNNQNKASPAKNNQSKQVMADAKGEPETAGKGKAKEGGKRKVEGEGKEQSGSDNSTGTVKASKDFHAEKDADRLYRAMDGLGTNEGEIIEILPQRSNAQRQEIRKAYNKKYDRDMIEDLKSELRGDFEELILALMMRPVEFDAYCLNDAVKGLGTDEATLVGILCTRSDKDISAIKEQYKNAYKSNLEDDVAEDTSNAFKEMLLALVKTGQDRGQSVDLNMVEEDVKKLHKDSSTSLSIEDGTLKTILTQRNQAQVKATFDKYKEVAGQDIYEGIKLAMVGDDQDGYIGLAKALDDPVDFYAERLNHSMAQAVGTDDKMLVRILVSRSEIDLAPIKVRFEELFKKSLKNSVESECSGDYKKALIAILGDNREAPSTKKDLTGELSQTIQSDDRSFDTLYNLLKNDRPSNHKADNSTPHKSIDFGKFEEEVEKAVLRLEKQGEKQGEKSCETSTGSRTDMTEMSGLGEGTDPVGVSPLLSDDAANVIEPAGGSDNPAHVIEPAGSDYSADVSAGSDNPVDVIEPAGSDNSADVIEPAGSDNPDDVIEPAGSDYSADVLDPVRSDNPADVEEPATSDISAKVIEPVQSDSPPFSAIQPTDSNNTSGVTELPRSSSAAGMIDPVQFEPGRDCESLFSLLSDKDMEEGKIFHILTKRSHKQRLQIRQKYQILYRQDLVRELRNKLSPTLEIVLGALMLDRVEYDALCIHQAVAGISVDDRTLVNILISGEPVHLKAVKIKFWQVYGKDLLDYLRKITNTELGELLLCLSCVTEEKGPNKDEEDQITEEANKIAKKLPTGEKSYLDVFHKKSSHHIKRVFNKYAEITGKDITDTLMKYKTGQVQRALLAFATWLHNPIQFYTTQLREAMSDPGVDGIILIHIIISRAEIDLDKIASTYIESYGVTLRNDLHSKCRADYKRILLPILEGV